MRTIRLALALVASTSIALVACTSSDPADSLDMNGTWAGVGERAGVGTVSVSATIEDRAITRLAVDDEATGERMRLYPIQDQSLRFVTASGVEGRLLTDPGKAYTLMVIPFRDFAVLQNEAQAPFGEATLADLDGEWRGTMLGMSGDTSYRFPATAVCSAGHCALTATGPATDETGGVVRDVTGVQSILEIAHRTRLAFDLSWTSTQDASGFGAAFLSKDRTFMGLYGCLSADVVDACEYGALLRE